MISWVDTKLTESECIIILNSENALNIPKSIDVKGKHPQSLLKFVTQDFLDELVKGMWLLNKGQNIKLAVT